MLFYDTRFNGIMIRRIVYLYCLRFVVLKLVFYETHFNGIIKWMTF